jgi:hypothetical protein
MRNRALISAVTASALLCAGAVPSPGQEAVLSKGAAVELTKKLVPEKPNVLVFFRQSSTLEREFVQELRKIGAGKVALHLVMLNTGSEPVAKQFSVTATPSAVVYDRRGRETGRGTDAAAIRKAVETAADVMRIDWPKPGSPEFLAAEKVLHGRPLKAGILRTMSIRPEYLAYINDLANQAHFKDQILDRRTKEMIATYVSALNKCKY